jgi:hypothetical protein
MDSVLEQELTGRPPVLVSLGGQSYPLEFSIHAVILYKSLTGDNLFDGACWQKIVPTEDPARFVACLWAGLHVYDHASERWAPPFPQAHLERLIDFSNATPLCLQVAQALAAYFPKAKPKEASTAGESPLPDPANPSSSAPASASASSGPLPASTCA